MDDDQQFCLRWNNHQSTLVSVFDNLLENGTLVDCTLFAEGKYLKAHKVVLSACSPYFEALLTQQYDKHPIFILKDVKFQELKAMMDYMYRGEVNISQDQLAALLKAAESLQIKGLSDSRSKESEPRKTAPPPVAKTPPPAPAPTLPRVQGLTIEQRKAPKLADTTIEDSRSREGSSSPVPRKRKKPRRRPSQEGVNDNHDASSSSESHSNQAPTTNIPSLPAVPLASTSKLTDVPEPVEAKSEIVTRQKAADSPQVPIKEKLETHSELILEPKSEYIEEDMNEDSVEDLTLDDDDVSQMEQEMDHARPGPSHGSTDGSAQGFGGWHMSGNQNQDEVFLAAQEAVGAHRDSQETVAKAERDVKKRRRDVISEKIIDVETVRKAKKLRKNFQPRTMADSIKKRQKKIDKKLNEATMIKSEQIKSPISDICEIDLTSSPEKEAFIRLPLAESTTHDFPQDVPKEKSSTNLRGETEKKIRELTAFKKKLLSCSQKETVGQEKEENKEGSKVQKGSKNLVGEKWISSPKKGVTEQEKQLPEEKLESAPSRAKRVEMIEEKENNSEEGNKDKSPRKQQREEVNELFLHGIPGKLAISKKAQATYMFSPKRGLLATVHETNFEGDKEISIPVSTRLASDEEESKKSDGKNDDDSQEGTSGTTKKNKSFKTFRKQILQEISILEETSKTAEEELDAGAVTIRSKKLKTKADENLPEATSSSVAKTKRSEEMPVTSTATAIRTAETYLICPICEQCFNKMNNYKWHLKHSHREKKKALF